MRAFHGMRALRRSKFPELQRRDHQWQGTVWKTKRDWNTEVDLLTERLEDIDSDEHALVSGYDAKKTQKGVLKHRYMRMPYLGVASQDLQAVLRMLSPQAMNSRHIGQVHGMDQEGSEMVLRGLAHVIAPTPIGTLENYKLWLGKAMALYDHFKASGKIHDTWTLGPKTHTIMDCFDSLGYDDVTKLFHGDDKFIVALYIRLCKVLRDEPINMTPFTDEELEEAGKIHPCKDVILDHTAELHTTRLGNKIEQSSYMYLDEAGFPASRQQFSDISIATRRNLLSRMGEFMTDVQNGAIMNDSLLSQDTQKCIKALSLLTYNLNKASSNELVFQIYLRLCQHLSGTELITPGEVVVEDYMFRTRHKERTRNLPCLPMFRNRYSVDILEDTTLLPSQKAKIFMQKGFFGVAAQLTDDNRPKLASTRPSVKSFLFGVVEILTNKGQSNSKVQYHREAEIYESILQLGITERHLRLKRGGSYITILLYIRLCKVLRGFPVQPGETLNLKDADNVKYFANCPQSYCVLMPNIELSKDSTFCRFVGDDFEYVFYCFMLLLHNKRNDCEV